MLIWNHYISKPNILSLQYFILPHLSIQKLLNSFLRSEKHITWPNSTSTSMSCQLSISLASSWNSGFFTFFIHQCYFSRFVCWWPNMLNHQAQLILLSAHRISIEFYLSSIVGNPYAYHHSSMHWLANIVAPLFVSITY